MTSGDKLKEDRIELAINLIKNATLSNYKIALDTKISQATIGNYKNGKTRPTEANAEIIIKYFSKDTTEQSNITEAEPVTEIITKRVPLVNQYAYAGYLTGYQDQEYIDQLPTVLFDVDHDPKGNYLAFEVKGDSMNDGSDESYKDGDRLLCREIPSHLWCNSKLHLRKWDFVIVHKEGVLVKRIVDHDVQNHTITIHSLNPFYEDQVIDLVDVYQIFNVIEYQRKTRR